MHAIQRHGIEFGYLVPLDVMYRNSYNISNRCCNRASCVSAHVVVAPIEPKDEKKRKKRKKQIEREKMWEANKKRMKRNYSNRNQSEVLFSMYIWAILHSAVCRLTARGQISRVGESARSVTDRGARGNKKLMVKVDNQFKSSMQRGQIVK